RVPPVLRLDLLELLRGERDRLLPRHLFPRLVDGVADHRLRDAVLVRRVAEREAALHARVAVVRVTVLVRDHLHDLLAFHLGAERRSEEHTSELQSRENLVCRLLLEKKNLHRHGLAPPAQSGAAPPRGHTPATGAAAGVRGSLTALRPAPWYGRTIATPLSSARAPRA